MKRSLIFMLFLVYSCASQNYHKENLKDVRDSFVIENVPFISGQEYFCGPSSFAMILEHLDHPIDYDQSVSMLYTPEKKGTHQQDIITAARRLGLLSTPVNDFNDLIIEVNNARPILVFKNLSFNWAPLWHYAVVIGHDLSEQELILHSGENEFERISFRSFQRMWNRTENWGHIFSHPEDIPESASQHKTLKSIASLELIGKTDEARISYEALLNRWKNSLGALVGLGNVHYEQGNYQQSYQYINKAHQLSPEQEAIKHNLSVIHSKIEMEF